jgi:hypothetical protein
VTRLLQPFGYINAKRFFSRRCQRVDERLHSIRPLPLVANFAEVGNFSSNYHFVLINSGGSADLVPFMHFEGDGSVSSNMH